MGAPTRELACQIQEQSDLFGRAIHVRTVCLYGGAPKGPQLGMLRRGGVDGIICTPGRLNDFLEMKKVDLRKVQFLILDEADRMLDMGFEPQIRAIVGHLPVEPDKPQTMLFSATWPKEIQKLAHDFLVKPVQLQVGGGLNKDGSPVANADVEQKFVFCAASEKNDELKKILESFHKDPQKIPKLILFVQKKISCDGIATRLWDAGYSVDSIHGDREQWERTRVINAFKSGVLKILVATDVAARGLDISDVELVVNYDMPQNIDDYVHRIGRTGRAGKKGISFSL